MRILTDGKDGSQVIINAENLNLIVSTRLKNSIYSMPALGYKDSKKNIPNFTYFYNDDICLFLDKNFKDSPDLSDVALASLEFYDTIIKIRSDGPKLNYFIFNDDIKTKINWHIGSPFTYAFSQDKKEMDVTYDSKQLSKIQAFTAILKKIYRKDINDKTYHFAKLAGIENKIHSVSLSNVDVSEEYELKKYTKEPVVAIDAVDSITSYKSKWSIIFSPIVLYFNEHQQTAQIVYKVLEIKYYGNGFESSTFWKEFSALTGWKKTDFWLYSKEKEQMANAKLKETKKK